jgi:spermidine synthase
VILSQAALLLLTFLAALCSLVYELVLAQILAATLGGSLLRYCTVVGLFSLSLGLGSLAYARREHSEFEKLRLLLHIELILSALGLLGPLAIVLLDPFRSGSSVGFIWEMIFYLPVVGVGFFSGYELPLLLSLCRDRRRELQTLSSDYIGMFAGSLLVPFVLYPLGGPFLGSVWVGLINLCAAGIVFFSLYRDKKWLQKDGYVFGILISVAVFLLIGHHYWLNWIREWFVS